MLRTSMLQPSRFVASTVSNASGVSPSAITASRVSPSVSNAAAIDVDVIRACPLAVGLAWARGGRVMEVTAAALGRLPPPSAILCAASPSATIPKHYSTLPPPSLLGGRGDTLHHPHRPK